MLVETWIAEYVVGDPRKKELNELQLKEFSGRLTKQDCDRMEDLLAFWHSEKSLPNRLKTS